MLNLFLKKRSSSIYGLFFSLLIFPFSFSLAQYNPPPTLGPSECNQTTSGGSISIPFIESIIEGVFDDELKTINESLPSRDKVSWKSSSEKIRVLTLPSKTEYRDKFNEKSIKSAFSAGLTVSRKYWGIFTVRRDVYIDFDLIFYCDQWITQNGQMKIKVKRHPIEIEENSTFLEDILDFTLLPLNLTNRITEAFKKELSSTIDTGTLDDSTFDALLSNADCNCLEQKSKIVLWDKKEYPLSQRLDKVRITFKELKRLSGLTGSKENENVRLVFWINGNYYNYPSVGTTLNMDVGDTETLNGFTVDMNINPVINKLQIIMVVKTGKNGFYNISSNNWIEFHKDTNYGNGDRKLTSQKLSYLTLPSPPPPSPKPKPRPIWDKRYEVSFEVEYSNPIRPEHSGAGGIEEVKGN